ncbi:uroporphyrinogen-III C-methyltransferase [Methylobacillus arboreus]|uniref:uroporphyrinogen-III C-methyltransferase n=1 Tax=Methylobacillus arboreus TaxID=755170 RepID=UPI001E57C3E3|nr:uroporphyrinogen-III C-methyltransferase [Methylobacillus arboreus]MCB5191099.1 uroporphyrinogen-III C-methyltransferase [Methylobacillus arboreus]
MAGRIFLIGAGPGDAELITLKAVKALASADVILLDDLVNRELLQHAPQARVIEVGKRGGCKSTPQHFINRMMVALAEQGQVVARLKGGDPFLFGRGGEEMLELRAAGIPVEVIPGITSGIAVPAMIGIPVTHRAYTHGVSFVTGHLQDGENGQNWKALAESGTTLVIYMGMKHISAITRELLASGMSPDTPAAAIQNGSLPQQQHVTSTLSHLTTAVRQAGLGSPAIIVIGDVVRLAHSKDLLQSVLIAA